MHKGGAYTKLIVSSAIAVVPSHMSRHRITKSRKKAVVTDTCLHHSLAHSLRHSYANVTQLVTYFTQEATGGVVVHQTMHEGM